MTKLDRILVFPVVFFTFIIQANAQMPTDSEIQQAVDAMRASGQSEIQVQQFLDNMKIIQGFQTPSSPDTSALARDIQKNATDSDKSISAIQPISNAIKAKQDQQFAVKLEKQIAAFEEKYAHKPDITAKFDGQTIQMKLIDCRTDDAYTVSAKAAPTQRNRTGLTIGASRGWSVMNNSWAANIGVQIDGESFHAKLPSDPLTNTGLNFDGMFVSQNDGREASLTFKATCT